VGLPGTSLTTADQRQIYLTTPRRFLKQSCPSNSVRGIQLPARIVMPN
jgi:hypothetical protein